MATTRRLSTTGALIVCLVGSQWSSTLLAGAQEPSSSDAPSSQPAIDSRSEPQQTTPFIRFTVDDELLVANAPVRAAGAGAWRNAFDFTPVDSGALAQRYWGRGRGGRNGAAQTAVVLGAVATIAGAALLVYANRPECSTNHTASACGYGTKVVGGAVLSAGVFGIVVGALTWR